MIPSRISLSFNLEMVILDLFNQSIVCVQKSLVNLQCKNKCSRDSSYSPQNVHNEVSVSLILFNNLLVYIIRLSILNGNILILTSKVTLCGLVLNKSV